MLRAVWNDRLCELYPQGHYITICDVDSDRQLRFHKDACRLIEQDDDYVLTIRRKSGEIYYYGIVDAHEIEQIYLWLRSPTAIHKDRNYAFWLLAGLTLVALIACVRIAMSNMDVAADYLIKFTPRSWEMPLANVAIKQMQDREVCTGEQGLNLLYHIAKPLLHNIGLDGKGMVKLIFVKGDRVTSLAMPGGVVVLESEVLRQAKSIDFIAAAMAREIVDVKERRPMRRIAAKIGTYAATAAVAPFLAATEPAVLVATKIMRFGYDKELRSRTDLAAAELLRKSGYSVRGLHDYLIAAGFSQSVVENYKFDVNNARSERFLKSVHRIALNDMCDNS